MANYTLDTPVKELMSNPETAAILKEVAPKLAENPMVANLPMSLKQLSGFASDKFTPEFLAKVEEALQKVEG